MGVLFQDLDLLLDHFQKSFSVNLCAYFFCSFLLRAYILQHIEQVSQGQKQLTTKLTEKSTMIHRKWKTCQ
jgi:sensor c-di-GMP phosphodiesterase-like protein